MFASDPLKKHLKTSSLQVNGLELHKFSQMCKFVLRVCP